VKENIVERMKEKIRKREDGMKEGNEEKNASLEDNCG
jgi:hypothetical protein